MHGAVLGTHGALAGNAFVVCKALALPRLAIAQTLVRALGQGVHIIVRHWLAYPSHALGTYSQRAVKARVQCHAVGAAVADAAIILVANSSRTAPIWAYSPPSPQP